MKTMSLLLSSSLTVLLLASCDQSSSNSAVPSSATDSSASHTHSDGTTHAEHASKEMMDSGHSHGGEITLLGTKNTLGFTVKAEQEGDVVAGQDAVFLIETDPASEAVRLWVGDEQATSSIRSKAEGGPTDYHAHNQVPSPLDDTAQLWVEVQNSDGDRGMLSFDLSFSDSSSSGHEHGEESSSESSDHSHEHTDGDHGHTH